MQIENQVCSIEQGLILKDLGISQDPDFSLFVHVIGSEYTDSVTERQNICSMDILKERVALFTTAELGEMIPSGYVLPHKKADGFWWQSHNLSFGITEANARAVMLIHLLKEQKITIDEVNKRSCK